MRVLGVRLQSQGCHLQTKGVALVSSRCDDGEGSGQDDNMCPEGL